MEKINYPLRLEEKEFIKLENLSKKIGVSINSIVILAIFQYLKNRYQDIFLNKN